jgi:hypothetical protein
MVYEMFLLFNELILKTYIKSVSVPTLSERKSISAASFQV